MRRRGIWLAPLLVLGLTSCGEPAATGAPDVGADAYVAAISEFLPPAPVDESEAKPVVFISVAVSHTTRIFPVSGWAVASKLTSPTTARTSPGRIPQNTISTIAANRCLRCMSLSL